MEKLRKNSKKTLIGLVGGLVVVVGIMLIPYPGPGWLVVFTGLAILATEFAFASRALHYAKGKYDAWSSWLKRQQWYVQGATLLFTGLVVMLTIWMVNGFGILSSIVGVEVSWLTSPLFR